MKEARHKGGIYYAISFIRNVQHRQILRNGAWAGSCQGLQKGINEKVTPTGYRVNWWVGENVLKLDSSASHNRLLNILKLLNCTS